MGQHVPRQGRGTISTYPGQLPQKGPKILHIKASMLLCKPRGASSHGGGALSKDQSYQNPSGIFLLGTESLQTEVPAWRCWQAWARSSSALALLPQGCPRTPVLPTGSGHRRAVDWVDIAQPAGSKRTCLWELQKPAKSELAESPQGHKAWHTLLWGTFDGSSQPLFMQ